MRVTPLKGPIDQENAIQLNVLLNLNTSFSASILSGLTGGRNSICQMTMAYWRAAFF